MPKRINCDEGRHLRSDNEDGHTYVCVECGRTYDANYEGKEYGRYYEEETGTWGTDRQKMIDFIFDTSKDDDEFVRRADNVVYLRMKVIDAQIGR